MKYDNIIKGKFISRPSRFIANVEINGKTEKAHIRNNGRCSELFIQGAEVYLTENHSTKKTTAYDLVVVRKKNGLLVNIDNRAAKLAVKEWLEKQGFSKLIGGQVIIDSKIDFYMEKENDYGSLKKFIYEVRTCTLEKNGVSYYPEAPVTNEHKLLRKLVRYSKMGYRTFLAFVIQINGVTGLKLCDDADPLYPMFFKEAVKDGLKYVLLPCIVEPDSLEIIPGKDFFQYMRDFRISSELGVRGSEPGG